MADVSVNTANRVFKYKDEVLPDPDPNMSPAEVISMYASAKPELTAGFIKDHQVEGDTITYEIATSLGHKG